MSRALEVLVQLKESDLALFKRLAGAHSPFLDKALPRLGRAANRSHLWFAIAGLLVVAGGRFGRRAAFRGVLSVGLTSALVNLPVKMLIRRQRPPLDFIPLPRRLLRIPISSSFPSGHAASAAAFATSVAMELPVAALPVGAAAVAVAFSRVYTGVHYPSDVVVGAGIGTAIAFATRRAFPLASRDAAEARPEFTAIKGMPSDDGDGLMVVANSDAGATFSNPPSSPLKDALPAALVVEAATPEEFERALEVAGDTAKAVGVAGGDGSVNLAAGIAHRNDKPLLVVPAGTLNHLARDLGLSSTDDAVEAFQHGNLAAVDLSEIAGKPFLNTASFGSYADLVDERDRLATRIGKWPAALLALIKVIRTGEALDVRIDGEARKIWMIFIGNCKYLPDGLAPSYRERLDDGLIDIRLVRADKPWSRTRLIAGLLTGLTGSTGVYERRLARQVQVESPNGQLRLARDGETFDGPSKFEIRKLERPLKIFVPQ